MNTSPKLTIITPSYNQGEYLERTIKSVLNQGYPNLEFIIADGGSTDNSVDIIKKYDKHITHWFSEKDRGQSHAFNKALKLATGDLIGWINSDDIYYPGAFEAGVGELIQHPECQVVFGSYTVIDELDNILHVKKEIPLEFKMYLWTNLCNHVNVAGFYRKEVFEKYGPLREDLQFSMDYEFYLRLASNGVKFRQIKNILGGYRIHISSKTITAQQGMVSENSKVRMNYFTHPIHPMILKLKTWYYCKWRYVRKFFFGCYTPQHVFSAIKIRKIISGG